MPKIKNINNFVIIGSSTGLGAALVSQFIAKDDINIIGVARTPLEKIESSKQWRLSGRYTHLELDITLPDSAKRFKELLPKFKNESICVVFNAAAVKADVDEKGIINYSIFREVNRVGIDGFSNIIEGFSDYLYNYGGIFVGISSFSSFMPPVFEPRIAYPASKAYLDMALRCFRLMWKNKIKVVTVHLGHLGKDAANNSLTTYSAAAKKIANLLLRNNVPDEINYPLSYCIVYKYLFKFIPDNVYQKLLRLVYYFVKNKK